MVKEPKAYIYKNGKKEVFTCPEPTRLSKAGEWRRSHPNGIGEILDYRAVMK